ncbi:PREDICTED: protein SFI1 homolog [Condylura cristata]|uniref:protein SFI1 homolog n=1 Tax=Condylura cristata TaxID=143302 RepID=UPI000642E1B5|nr:PREDICTED: protein SFI1 homolog [Condylura cristata]
MRNLIIKKIMSSHWQNFYQKGIKQNMEKKVDSRSFRGGAVKKPYSPKILSNKKPSAFSGTPNAHHPVQHHAPHAWTRRGRLRELRIRCVARKFLYLWIRITFGRVCPSKARFYYEQRVLRRIFEEWKEEWWVSHREWKLCIRADCHYRYSLYNLMFQAWKSYVHAQHEMRSKYLRAENHDGKQKMRRAWKSWLIYVVFRRTKCQMHTTALEFRQRSIMWVCWREWKWGLEQLRVRSALHASAVKHWALSLQLQAWSQWQEQLLHVWRERRKMVSAARHHQHWQKWKFLKAWLQYLQVRRVKRQQHEMAERFHHATVLQTHFCDWQRAREQRELLHTHRALVGAVARRMALRRAFAHWKHYVLLCAEAAAQWKVAEEHHRCGLLRFCFRALKDHTARAHLQRIRSNLAHQQHDALLLRRFWNLWKSRIEQREETEQLPLLHAAWNHCRITLLRKCVQLWLQCLQKRRHKQLLQARADDHFQQRALPVAFRAWKASWQWSQQESARDARAARFHREMVEKQVLAIWWQKTFQCQENRLAERMAILHAERQLLRRSWSTWCQQTTAHRRERLWQAAACAHHRRGRLRRAFCVWRESARGRRTERLGSVLAADFHSARLRRGTWNRWREVRLSTAPRCGRRSHASVTQRHMAPPWSLGNTCSEASPRLSCLLRGPRPQWGNLSSLGVWPASAKWQKLMPADPPQHALLHRAQFSKAPAEPMPKRTSGLPGHRRGAGLCRFQSACLLQRYQSRVRRILQEVAARESACRRQLLRKVLRRWRENTIARVEEAKKTSQARAHYSRALCSQVLVQWRETVSVQIYYRQQEDCAIREARSVLERGSLRTWFRRWLARGQRVARQREQLEKASLHHRRTLLLAALARWKAYCLDRVRRKLLQRLGTQLRARALRRSCFCQWKLQLLNRRREQQGTARALWFWSFCLQAKVWAAWLDFVSERRRKKARLEHAAQAYRQQLLREGVARLLRFAAGMKAFRQQLHAQQQVQAARSLHRAVHRCATLWKQKALGPGKKPQPPGATGPSRRGTFQDAPLSGAAAAGGAPLETKGPKAAPGPWGALGSLTLAAGNPLLLELSAPRSSRKQPRCPHFLLEPMQSLRPLEYGVFGGQGPEKRQVHGLGPSWSGPIPAEMQAAPTPSSPLPQLGLLPSLPDPKVFPTASAGPELLPPSCFMPRGKDAPARVSVQPTTPELVPQASPSLVSARNPNLLLPGDFTGTRPGSAGVVLRPHSIVRAQAAPSTWETSIQPGPGRQGQDQVHSPVATSHTDLEAELEGIQQQLQHCQTTKQNLWSCQRQARCLRRWLELSREEPRPEARAAEQLVEEELQQVELQIQQLATELQAQRQPIRACIARVQALRQALG